MKCTRPDCGGTLITAEDGGKVCLLCGRPFVDGTTNPQKIFRKVSRKRGRRVCRKIK